MTESRHFSKYFIYQASEPYDLERPEYDCYRPLSSGSYVLFDCWVCNGQGEVHPGYSAGGVPVNRRSLLDPVAIIVDEPGVFSLFDDE
jgi:hypothetical protein